jgi:hypothetical protein
MRRRTFWAGILLLTAVGLANPAEARARKKRKRAAPPPAARAEDDPRKRGNSPAFRKASVAFAAPADLSEHDDGAIEIRLAVKGYAIGALKPGGPVPHAHLIVDNEAALEIADVRSAWTLRGLSPGPHFVRAVLCRPWHEVVKAPKAFAMARFWIGPKLGGKAGKAAESVSWPHPRRPLLTYVLPVGEPPENLELSRVVEETAAHDAAEAKPSEEGAGGAVPGANRPVLDFYFANGKLGRRGDKVRLVLDKRELPLITEWKPLPLRRAHAGKHWLSVDLLSRKGLKVHNVANRSDRAFTAEQAPRQARPAAHAELGNSR